MAEVDGFDGEGVCLDSIFAVGGEICVGRSASSFGNQHFIKYRRGSWPINQQGLRTFWAISRGGLYEVLSQLDVAERLGYLSIGKDIEDLAKEIARMLGSMLKKYGAIHCSTSTCDFD